MLPLLLAQILLEIVAPPAVPLDPLIQPFNQAFPLMAMALFMSVCITALMYMVGNALQSPDLIALGKDNLGNLLFSALVVLLFMALFGVFSELAGALACGQPCNHVQAAYFSVLVLRFKLLSLYSVLYSYELLFGFASSLGFSFPLSAISPTTLLGALISIPSISFSPLSGLAPLSSAHTIIVEAVGTALMMVMARQVMLEFIGRYLFIFFVLGAALRSFVFTRKTGSSLLALAAVAYFVYPLAVLLTNYLIFSAYQPADFGIAPTAIGYCSDPGTAEDVAASLRAEQSGLYNQNIEKESVDWFDLGGVLSSAAKFVGGAILKVMNVILTFNVGFFLAVITSPLMFSSFYDFILLEVQTEGQFLAVVFISFFIEVVVTITMYRGISQFMEGETEIFGVSKLI
ncbi:MAG: hypothetical protein WC488_02670 [Candidatus Micrarchaeia archaeon]